MPRKPIELPPEVARRFVNDMCAYFAEQNSVAFEYPVIEAAEE